MKTSTLIYATFLMYVVTVSGQEPTEAPTSSTKTPTRAVCPWEFDRGDKCSGYNSIKGVGGDCKFNAQGVLTTSCRRTAKVQCKKDDSVTKIKGCRRSCQRFHRRCCCPATTESPTSSPTKTQKPSSKPPTESPTISCPWSNFKRSSSCASYDREVGGDCKFDARDDQKVTTCGVVSKQKCDVEKYGKVKGCKSQCRMFHERCCCPAGGNKPWIDDKPLVDGKPILNKPILDKPIRPIVNNKGDNRA